MASDIFNVEPPRWLQAIAQPIDTKLTGQVLAIGLTSALGAQARKHELVPGEKPGEPPHERGGSWLKNFVESAGEAKLFLIDPFWKLKAQQLQLKTAGDILSMIHTRQQIDMNKAKMANEAQDLDEIPAWLQDHPTPESRLNATWPAGRTPAWRSTLNQLRSTDTRSTQMRMGLEAAHAYTRRLDSLAADKTDPQAEVAVAGLRAIPMPDTGPTPEMLIALSRAEQESGARKAAKLAADEQARKAAEEEGRKLGGIESVTVGPRGVSRTFKSLPPTLTEMPKPFVDANGVHWAFHPTGRKPGEYAAYTTDPKRTPEKPRLVPFTVIQKQIDDAPINAMMANMRGDKAGADAILADAAKKKKALDEAEAYSQAHDEAVRQGVVAAPPSSVPRTNAPPIKYTVDPTTGLLRQVTP